MDNANKKVKDFYNSLNKEELKNLLIKCGFEVKDGSGKVVFKQEINDEISFVITSELEINNDNILNSKVNYIYAFPIAS